MTVNAAGRRVFVGPVEIAGIGGELAAGLNELGVKADVVLAHVHPFAYRETRDGWLLRMWQRLGATRAFFPRRHVLRKALLVALHGLCGWLVLMACMRKYDAFLFLSAQTITNSRLELLLLRWLGKKLIFIYVGSDARPPFMDGGPVSRLPVDPKARASALVDATRRRKQLMKFQESQADFVVNAPATAQFNEKPFINWFSMGIPKSIDVSPVSRPPREGPVRVLHCPSNPALKGSARIRDAVQALQDKGLAVELVEITGVAHARVLDELRQCDIVVDQLYSDTPMAAFATEAAFFARPTIVGGYFSAVAGDYINDGDMPPTLFVPPEEIQSALEQLVLDRTQRESLGMAAYRFVADRWASRAVASRYLQLLEGRPDSSWWCDPAHIVYVQGYGLSEQDAASLAQAMLATAGDASLQISDKPALLAAVHDLAARAPSGVSG